MDDGFQDHIEHQKFLANLHVLQTHKDVIERTTRELARSYRVALDSLMAEGLTPHQALEIVKVQGPFLSWGNNQPGI